MKKKIVNVVLFLAVLAAALGMTFYVGNNAMSVLLYNFVFLGIIAVVYVVGLFGGMFRMNRLAQSLGDAAQELEDMFKMPGRVAPDKIESMNGIFHNHYLDAKMKAFTDGIAKSQEGIVDIEEYINEEDLDLHIHKKLLEMAPDLFTSIGILGTFVGLVWGLKDFQPANYEAMTSSVSSLVDGIKVAFLTSIYGIAFSIVYTSGMKSEYSALTENLQLFLDKFHTYVMPSAETESMNLLVASQKNQTAAMNQMAEQFSVKMADSFEKVITPTFKKMNDSLDTLVSSVTKCQEDAVKEILDAFLKEMNTSFEIQFADFGKALTQLKDAQTDNTNYTTNLYQAMSKQLSDAYVEHEQTMKKMIEESTGLQKEYITAANRILLDNQTIQKQQQADYQHLADYLKEAEMSSAKFWVACNQTMQKYVEAAAQGMERISAAGKSNADVAAANRQVVEEFDQKLQEFAQYQKLSCKTMEQVRRLLTDISAAGSSDHTELYKQPFHKENLSISTKKVYKSSDTEKYVYELKDNRYIETVFIKRRDGGTVCVSTQVGCSVGCIFCESGRNGFVRNLTPSEIVQQVVLIRQKVNRIVFMGMGEPLFNYDNLIAAIHILRDRNGLNFPTDGITVSTVGPVNQLKKLREEHLKIQLTISLHAATQAARNCIIPHMHMYAIEDVVKQALSYSQRHNRKVVFAYLLLPGINDRSSDIRQLAKWFKGKNVMINVLQYNPTSNSKIRAPQKQEMVAFKHQLEQTGLEVTMRVSHGREIKAACGQLANTYNKAKKQQK